MSPSARKRRRLGMLLGLGAAFPGAPISNVIEYHAPDRWLVKQEVGEHGQFFLRPTELQRILQRLKRTSLYSNLSLDVACHEVSHALAFHILHDVKELRLKVHRWGMLRDLGRGPREVLQTLANFLTGGGRYAFGGYVECSYDPGFLGSVLGRKLCDLLISAAGTAGELGLALLLYWAGRRARDRPIRGGALQTLSCGVVMEALEYPWMGYGDWSVISRMTGLPTWMLALGISCAYALATLGVYTLGREGKRMARRKAFSRLLDPYFADKLVSMVRSYARAKPRLVRLLEGFPMGKGVAGFLHGLERKKRNNELLRYGIVEFGDFEARKGVLRKRIEESKLLKKIKLKRLASKLEGLKGKVIDNFLAMEDEARDLVEREARLYDLLVKNSWRFEEDPKGFASHLRKKLGFEPELERLRRFYEGNGPALQALTS